MLHEDSGANENMSEKLSLENELLCVVVKQISKMCFLFLTSLIKFNYLSNSLHLRVIFFRMPRPKESEKCKGLYFNL